MKTELAIIKCDHAGEEVIRYPARVLEQDDERVVVEAHFRPEPIEVGGLRLVPGDRFVESYFPERWYNIYEVHSGVDDQLKGWYCNVTYPPEIGPDAIRYRDLALDLVVSAEGRQVVLDEDEFEELDLSAADRKAALAALAALRERFARQFEQ